MKTLCAFGYFDLSGERSWVIRKGLEEAGFTVSLCRTEVPGFWPKIHDLLAQWKQMKSSVDVLYVVFPGHYLMPIAWWLAKRKRIPLVLDVFISLYETEVEDRAHFSPWHPKAALLWLFDWLACTLAEKVLIDTPEHRDYFVQRYRIAERKFLVVPVGCRTDLFQPISVARTPGPFRVRFHGSFIPLHGIETILRAAKELEGQDIAFECVGKGQTLPAMRALSSELELKNVRFLDPIPLRAIPAFIAGADVCLGIFSPNPKAKRVVPTKAFEILAVGKPLITARTPASERVFRNRENALLVTSGDPHSLANAIRSLIANPSLAFSIAENGHRLFLQKFQPRTIVESLVEWLCAH